MEVLEGHERLVVTWDPPLDPGYPRFESYVLQIKPNTDEGWDCEKPDGGRWTSNDADTDPNFPTWVAVYCVYDHPMYPLDPDNPPSEEGYYAPAGGWAKVTYNYSGSGPGGPLDLNSLLLHSLTNDVEYQVRMKAGDDDTVEYPTDSGTYVDLFQRMDRRGHGHTRSEAAVRAPEPAPDTGQREHNRRLGRP